MEKVTGRAEEQCKLRHGFSKLQRDYRDQLEWEATEREKEPKAGDLSARLPCNSPTPPHAAYWDLDRFSAVWRRWKSWLIKLPG